MAHTCPECGLLCHCGGDIDDCQFDGTKYQLMCSHCDDEGGASQNRTMAGSAAEREPTLEGGVSRNAWLSGLRYFVLSGPIPPSTVYRLQSDGELEMMLDCGWNKSVSNQMTGLHEMSEGAARFIWERLFLPPNDIAHAQPDKPKS